MRGLEKKKDFDAVALQRRLRAEISAETKDMSAAEFHEYIQQHIPEKFKELFRQKKE